MKTGATVLLILGIVTGIVWWATFKQPGGITTANTEGLKDRLAGIGLPALAQEGTELHTHQHLDIWIDGQKNNVPEGIGIGPNESFIAPIHTHDATGIIHVESPTVQKYYLGQFLTIWGVKLPTNCQYYVNGQSAGSNPGQIELTPHEEIAMVCGENVNVPKSYEFPPGY